jgi:cytochrome c oxidase cbb3-type subunit 3/ubiquinol-cytochrome c reductase cytochrome c subunit
MRWRLLAGGISGGGVVGPAGLCALLLLGCEAMPGRPNPADRYVVPAQVTSFGALYRQSCAGCHGTDGRLGAARPLNDALYLALVPPDRLREIIARGVPGGMQHAFAASAGGPLTDAQVDILAREMRARWGRPGEFAAASLPSYSAPAGDGAADPQRGRQVFAAACAPCHGTEGTGGPKAGSVVDASYLALVSDQALRTAVIAGRPDLGMPDWRGYISGRPLTAREVSDVVAWLVSQRRPPAGRPAAGMRPGHPQNIPSPHEG